MSFVDNKREPAVVAMRPVDVDVRWEYKRIYHGVPEVRIAALRSESRWSGDVLVTLSGSHVVIRESGRGRRGIATWTSKSGSGFLWGET